LNEYFDLDHPQRLLNRIQAPIRVIQRWALLYSESRVTYCKALHHSTEIVKFHNLSLTVMNSSNGINQNNDRTKKRAAIPAAGAIFTAAILLSGLSLIGSNQQPVLAQQQQNMTGGAGNATNATMTGAGNATNATMTGAGNATNATMTGAGNATNATMTGAGNATSGNGGEGTTTAGGPATGEGEGSGGGAAGSGGTTTSSDSNAGATTAGGPATGEGEGSGGGAAGSGGTDPTQ
jgi:hypothetical protein